MWRWISIALIVILIGGGIVAKIMVDELQGEIFQLQSNYDLLKQELVPHDYYSSNTFLHHSNTYSELCRFLKSEFVLPRDYEAGIFDCTESSAYLEWALENAGFDAYIAVGSPPHPSDAKYHAWVIVYTEDPYKVAIEATALVGGTSYYDQFSSRTPGIIVSGDPGEENYYNGYDHLYKDIYQCISNYKSVQEWNWWGGCWGFD